MKPEVFVDGCLNKGLELPMQDPLFRCRVLFGNDIIPSFQKLDA